MRMFRIPSIDPILGTSVQAWLPRPLVQPVAACLSRLQFNRAVGFATPPPWLRALVRGVPRLRAGIKSVLSIERYPDLLAGRRCPGRNYTIEQLGPDGLHADGCCRPDRTCV